MSMEVKKHIRLMGLYFKLNLSSAMEYRVSFLVQVFGMMVNNVTFVFFWWIMFQRIGHIEGYTFKDVMFIWALASSAFGFTFIMFGNVRNITAVIINGELDAYLLQPKDVYVNVICSRTIVSGWGDFAYGFALFFTVYGFDIQRLLMFTCFVIFGGLLLGSIMASAETLTFFIGNASGITRMVTEFMITFSIYPESIFKQGMRWVFYSFLPAGFITFIPLKLARGLNWSGVPILMAIDVLYLVLGYMFFIAGLKRYESGNLMTTRL